ncbi:AAA-like domain-containing protein [Floridanema aerugineum]|uniref:AAA-like domain-containing protein n=1 Tax=Floridaenema aerugineum BLCC-F46 TaxID=3153654 RepID=A0ABV4X1K9_9CYAN
MKKLSESMDWECGLEMINQALLAKVGRQLSLVEVAILKGAWEGETYEAIADAANYSAGYLKRHVGPKLWQMLSEALEQQVSKSNFRLALEQIRQQNQESKVLLSANNPTPVLQPVSNSDRAEETPIVDRYVKREPIETICYETLLQPGSLIRIKAPSLMGKTLLVNHTLAKLATGGYRTGNLSFELADRKTHLTNLDKFLRWFCINVSRELEIPPQLDDYWDEEDMGSKVSCTTYFEDYLLSQDDSPVVLCLDDVDLLFPHPEIYEDFFGLLRSWYEKARSRQRWKKLRLIIVHSTDVYIRLNINQSPFNVGLPIELSEFSSEQVVELAKQQGLESTKDIIEALMQLLGGHPYLIEQALFYLKNHPEITLEQMLADAPTDRGIYASHLRKYWLNLQSNPDLAEAFKKVITSNQPVHLQPIQAYQLQSMGLVKLAGNEIEPRCKLYCQYFLQHLEDIQ